jgi:hypothetical protein
MRGFTFENPAIALQLVCQVSHAIMCPFIDLVVILQEVIANPIKRQGKAALHFSA